MNVEQPARRGHWLGALTPVGSDVTTSWQNLKAGNSGIARTTLFDPANRVTQIAGKIKGFDLRNHFDVKEARRLERLTQFAVVAAREAITDAHLEINQANNERIAVVIDSGVGGAMSFTESGLGVTTRAIYFRLQVEKLHLIFNLQ